MNIKNMILGCNLDAMIFAFYNPDYIIFKHEDLEPPKSDPPSPLIMDTVVRIFANEYNHRLLCDLNLDVSTETIYFHKHGQTPNDIVKKKLTDVAKGISLPLPVFAEANKPTEISKTDKDTNLVYKLPFSELKKALWNKVCGNVYDVSEHGHIERICKDKILFKDKIVFYQNMILTAPTDKTIDIVSGHGFEILPVASLPTSLYLFKAITTYESPIIKYNSAPDSLYNRINYAGKYFVVDVTGEIDPTIMEAMFKHQGELLDHIVIPHGKIRKQFYNQYPAHIFPLGRFANVDPDHRIEDTVRLATEPEHLFFHKIWESQKRINRSYQKFPHYIPKKEAQSKEFLLRMFHQSARLLDNINWKKNKEQKPLSHDEISKEWFDMFRYWLSIGQTWEISFSDFLERIKDDF